MLGTKPLLSTARKGLLQALHPPLPPTEQQMQRFLKAVTTSFRRNLDKEHGMTRHPDEDSSPLQPAGDARSLTTTGPVPYERDSGSQERVTPFEKHVRSLVSNPLFRGPSSRSSPLRQLDPPTSEGTTVATDGAPGAASNRDPTTPASYSTMRDPMDVFEVAVAKGLMTIRIAKGCLESQKRMLVGEYQRARAEDHLPPNSLDLGVPLGMHPPLAALAGHDVAARVLVWLSSTPAAATLDFVADAQFSSLIVTFLAADGRDDVVWSWIDRLLAIASSDVASAGGGSSLQRKTTTTNDNQPAAIALNHASQLLYRLSRAHLVGEDRPDTALEIILAASRLCPRERDPARHAAFVAGPWAAIAHTAGLTRRVARVASPALLDCYLAEADGFLEHRHRSSGRGADGKTNDNATLAAVEVGAAHLRLHHPEAPTYHPATKYFERMRGRLPGWLAASEGATVAAATTAPSEKTSETWPKIEATNMYTIRRDVSMGFAAVALMRVMGKIAAAARLERILKTLYHKYDLDRIMRSTIKYI